MCADSNTNTMRSFGTHSGTFCGMFIPFSGTLCIIFAHFTQKRKLFWKIGWDSRRNPWPKMTVQPSAWLGYGVLDTFKFGSKISISWKCEPNWWAFFWILTSNYCYYSITSNQIYSIAQLLFIITQKYWAKKIGLHIIFHMPPWWPCYLFWGQSYFSYGGEIFCRILYYLLRPNILIFRHNSAKNTSLP